MSQEQRLDLLTQILLHHTSVASLEELLTVAGTVQGPGLASGPGLEHEQWIGQGRSSVDIMGELRSLAQARTTSKRQSLVSNPAQEEENNSGDNGRGAMVNGGDDDDISRVLPVDGVAASVRRQQQPQPQPQLSAAFTASTTTSTIIDENDSALKHDVIIQHQHQGQDQGQDQALTVLGHLAERTTPSSFAHFTHCDPFTNHIMLPPTHLHTHTYTYTYPQQDPAVPITSPPLPTSPLPRHPSSLPPPMQNTCTSSGQNSGTISGQNSGTVSSITTTNIVQVPVTVSFCGWVRVGTLSSTPTAMLCQLTTTPPPPPTPPPTTTTTSHTPGLALAPVAIAEVYFRLTHKLKGLATQDTSGGTGGTGGGISDTRSVASAESLDGDSPYNNHYPRSTIIIIIF